MAFEYYEETGITPLKIIGPIMLILLATLIVLIIVHYTITPIFKTTTGKGYIPVPGIRTTGFLYWPRPVHDDFNELNTPLQNISENYSLTVDFYFSDLTSGLNQTQFRPIFTRYNPVSQTQMTPNLAMYLEPHVNDIIVKVFTREQTQEIIRVRNVVAKTPLRIGVVMGSNYFEVYRNGLLVGTRTLGSQPSNSTGIIQSNPGAVVSTASASAATACPSGDTSGPLGYSMNLNFWNRILSPAEMRYAGPAMPSAATFTM